MQLQKRLRLAITLRLVIARPMIIRAMIIAMFAMIALPCWASEAAVLRNGFSIRYERREVLGNVTRLYVNADGSSYVDVATADIDHFEAAPDAPASPPEAKNGTLHPVSGFATIGGSNTQSLDDLVNSASGRYRLDPDLVNSVIKAESGFNVRAVSPKGAQGLMQLMPGTASQLGVPNAFDPRSNVEGGTRYLRELLERYNFDLVKALAAYNAGPQRVERFGGVPPYYETRAYVARVVRDFNKKKALQEKAASASSPKTQKDKEGKVKPHTSPSGSAVAQAKSTPSE